MSISCDYCGKGKMAGQKSVHHRGVAGGQWKKRATNTIKIFKPNLHKYMGLRLCTKCLRLVKGKTLAMQAKEVKEEIKPIFAKAVEEIKAPIEAVAEVIEAPVEAKPKRKTSKKASK